MKKWTVTLVSQDGSKRRTLAVSDFHFWAAVFLLVGLTFSTAFFFERHRVIAAKAEKLCEINRALELENARKPQVVETAGLSEEQKHDIESKLRAEYDASIGAINAKLNELYVIETKARNITGMAPRGSKAKTGKSADGNGKGGPSSAMGRFALNVDDRMRPPAVIYGLARPSADLILQEIRLRRDSFGDLVRDMEVRIEAYEKAPSIWPLMGHAGSLSSGFGYRRDPIDHRVSVHNGIDVCAPIGTKISATARGTVISAGWDGDFGNLVKLSHGGGIETWYGHMLKVAVRPGQTVGRGELIGFVGMTGRTTGPHVHYEVHKGGTPVDPMKYLTE